MKYRIDFTPIHPVNTETAWYSAEGRLQLFFQRFDLLFFPFLGGDILYVFNMCDSVCPVYDLAAELIDASIRWAGILAN